MARNSRPRLLAGMDSRKDRQATHPEKEREEIEGRPN
jgi:hypothetical protein